MATTKIPISFNDDEIQKVKKMAEYMGISDIYGFFPKAVKFSINLAISAIEYPHKVYSGLPDAELEVFFNSVRNSEIKHRNIYEAVKLLNLDKKV